jgi:hypothetical protein
MTFLAIFDHLSLRPSGLKGRSPLRRASVAWIPAFTPPLPGADAMDVMPGCYKCYKKANL